MNEANRYAPPAASVTDIDAEPDMPMPRAINIACWLLWLSLVVGLIRTVTFNYLQPSVLLHGYLLVSTVIGLVIGIGIMYWFTWAIRGGRNWMRWLLTILWALGVALIAIAWSTYVELINQGMIAPIVLLLEAVQFLMFTVALVLLHTSLAREWFTRDRY